MTTYKMEDVYDEVNNTEVELEIDDNDLIIRIPYLSGDAQDIIDYLDPLE